MKKNILLLCVLLSSCQNKQAANQLTMCTSLTYPPYESVDANGKPTGFDIDMAEAIADQLKKKLVIKDMSFDSLILSLQQNKCDILMAGMSITPSRQKEITQLPYQGEPTKSYYLLFWKKDPISIEQLKSKTIAVMSGTWMENYLNTIIGITPKALESNTELILEIQYAKSAAAFVEPNIAKDMMSKQPNIKAIEIQLPEADWNMGNGIGIKKSNTELAKQIQNALDDIKKSGLSKQLEQKWLAKK